MSIVTKTGDAGTTGLWSGERLGKDEPRVEAYGTVDELDATIGEAKHFLKVDESRRILDEVQHDLYRLAGQLATKSGVFPVPIEEADETRITGYVKKLEQSIVLTGFVVPGSTISSAKLDVARTIARRAERRIITLNRMEPVSTHISKYINRLSDLLYMLARAEEEAQGGIKYVKKS